MRVFLAGATGVIGRRLVPLLLDAGHEVTGATRSPERAALLEAAGARSVVVDVYDRHALLAAVQAARPEVVMHQLTDLTRPGESTPSADTLARNARIRIEGTRNLIDAALAAGARRFVAQSICFIYAPGPEPHAEGDPVGGAGSNETSIGAVRTLEELTTATPGIEGLVLRYGRFYGPGARTETPPGRAPVHVDAAAHAAVLALDRGEPGIYNVAEDDGYASIERAQRLLGWDPAFRIGESSAGLPAGGGA